MADDAGLKAGAVAVAAAVVIGGIVVARGGGIGEDETCSLTAAGVGLVAEGLSRGRSSSSIVAGLGAGTGAGTICKGAIDRMVEDPGAEVPLTVETESETIEREVTADELTAPAPQPPASQDVSALLCFRYDAGVLRQWCLDGIIDPPQ